MSPAGTNVTRADSVARFTAASCTPGTFFSARSTRFTHEAQVIPATPRSRVERRVAVSMDDPSLYHRTMNQVFQVQGMSCGHCVQAVTDAVKAVDPKAEVKVDLASGKVDVET